MARFIEVEGYNINVDQIYYWKERIWSDRSYVIVSFGNEQLEFYISPREFKKKLREVGWEDFKEKLNHE